MADKQDLFHSGVLPSCIVFFSIPAPPAFVEGDFPRDRPSAGFFFAGAAELQKALNATQTAVCVVPPGLLCWYDYVFTPILDRFHVPPGDREYILAFYIRGLMAIIDRWLRDDCRDSIGHIVAVMQQCTKRVPE